MRNWGAKKDLTLAQQDMFLRISQIVKGNGTLSNGELIWRFEVQPSPLSRTYNIRLEYTRSGTPDVFVETPDLDLLVENRPLPHIYNNPVRLCLYMPSTGQWCPTKRLDQTIVPWTFIWLYYFEEWLDSNHWKGGGKHPGEEPQPPCNRRQRRALAHL